jgi:hypothetical protein
MASASSILSKKQSILNEAGNLRESNSTRAEAQLKDAMEMSSASFNYERQFNMHKCRQSKPHFVQDASPLFRK